MDGCVFSTVCSEITLYIPESRDFIFISVFLELCLQIYCCEYNSTVVHMEIFCILQKQQCTSFPIPAYTFQDWLLSILVYLCMCLIFLIVTQMKKRWYFTVVLCCISKMTNGIAHLFMCLLDTGIPMRFICSILTLHMSCLGILLALSDNLFGQSVVNCESENSKASVLTPDLSLRNF